MMSLRLAGRQNPSFAGEIFNQSDMQMTLTWKPERSNKTETRIYPVAKWASS